MPIEEKYVQCPYNPSHQLRAHCMSGHLVKCRKQYPTTEMAVCPLNATHQICKPEMPFHLENCSDLHKVEGFKYVVGEDCVVLPEATKIEVPPPLENWDVDDSTPMVSYLDVMDRKNEMKDILRHPVGLTKAERRRFHQAEVERLDAVKNGTIAAWAQPDCEEPVQARSLPRPKEMSEAFKVPHRLGGGRGISVQAPSKEPRPGGMPHQLPSTAPPPDKASPSVEKAAEEKGNLNKLVKTELASALTKMSVSSNPGDINDDDGFELVLARGRGRGHRKV